jgi:hypothetical protein
MPFSNSEKHKLSNSNMGYWTKNWGNVSKPLCWTNQCNQLLWMWSKSKHIKLKMVEEKLVTFQCNKDTPQKNSESSFKLRSSQENSSMKGIA